MHINRTHTSPTKIDNAQLELIQQNCRNADTSYCKKNPERLAIDWLLRDDSGNTDCAHELFVKRYTLAAINFHGSVIDSISKENYNDDYDDNDDDNYDNDDDYKSVIDEFCPNDNKKYVKDNLWLSTAKQCSWPTIVCKGGSVENLMPHKSSFLSSFSSTKFVVHFYFLRNFCLLRFFSV